jgi:hypothetical protein
MGRRSDDSFLDEMRRHGDAPADDAVRRLVAEHGVEAVNLEDMLATIMGFPGWSSTDCAASASA